MSEKQLQLCSYNHAKRLQAAGFDWPTEAFFYPGGNADIWVFTDHNKNGKYSAPSIALALKWCRDVKGVICGVAATTDGSKYVGAYGNKGMRDRCVFSTYDEAESALLDAILDYLEGGKGNG